MSKSDLTDKDIKNSGGLFMNFSKGKKKTSQWKSFQVQPNIFGAKQTYKPVFEIDKHWVKYEMILLKCRSGAYLNNKTEKACCVMY